MTYRLRRQRGQARPSASKDRWEEQEGELARTILLPALIRCVGDAILCDVQLIEANGNGNESEEEEDDMMHMKYNDDGDDDGEAEDDDAIDLLNMIDLEIGDECPLPTDDAGVSNFRKTRHFGPESLLDALYGLAKLSDIKRRAANAGDGSFRPLAVATCRAIISDDEGASYVPKLWHTSLVETVWSLAVLDLRDETVLLDAIGNRLEKGDAFGKLTGKQLLTVLWSYATLDRPHQGIMRAFMRRLRRVRHQLFASDIAQAIWSAARLIERLDDEAELDDASGSSYELDVAAAQLREEAIMLCHTLSNELMSPMSNDSAEPKLLDLTAGATADIVRAFADLEIGHEAPILSALSCHLRKPKIMKHCSLDNIARLLLSFHRLGLKEETETIRMLCNRFTELVDTNHCDGKTLNTILRSVVMLQPVDIDASYQIVFDAAARIINDDDRGMALCSQCNEFEISSITWSFAKAKYIDDGVMMRLANRMMEEDVSQLCSPSSISRMLWSYTVLLSLADDAQGDDEVPIDVGQQLAERRETLFLLFQSLSWVLLSSQLNPIDCTAAMWAMAHASYPLDLSVFDHLAETLSQDTMLERASTECISQALWSCGKMSG